MDEALTKRRVAPNPAGCRDATQQLGSYGGENELGISIAPAGVTSGQGGRLPFEICGAEKRLATQETVDARLLESFKPGLETWIPE